MTDEAKPYKWQRDARANNAEAAYESECARAEAAEARAARLAAAGDDVAGVLEAIIEENEPQDAEAIEHCKALIYFWRAALAEAGA